MKLGKLLFGTTLFLSVFSYGQEQTEQERECDRMRFLATEELKIQNYPAAVTYYLKGEVICGGYDKANYDRLIGTIRNAISGETDKAKKTAYIDTLLDVYNRTEEKGFYDSANDLIRATYIIQASKPDRKKADMLFSNGIAKAGITASEAHITYYYYNLYVMYTETEGEAKAALKKRLITEYFNLSRIVSEAKMSVKAQENLTIYFNNVVRSCEDILPELSGFMSSFPQDLEMKKASVKNFIQLIESKGCTDSKEYEMLIDTLNAIDPTVDGKLAKARWLVSKKRYSDAISTLKEAKGMAQDAEKKEEIEYMIAEIQFNNLGSYNAAYTTAMGISGKYKSDALKLAAACVARTANNCGSSTFERKANNLYAAQLADRAGDSSAAAKYRAAGPTDQEWFTAGVTSVQLSCWGVTVNK